MQDDKHWAFKSDCILPEKKYTFSIKILGIKK